MAWKDFKDSGPFFTAELTLGPGPLQEADSAADPLLPPQSPKWTVAETKLKTGLTKVLFAVYGDFLEFRPETVETLVTDSSFMSKNTCGGGNCLIKDLTIHGWVQPSGGLLVALGATARPAVLVVQGEGNHCANEDMKQWMLLFDAAVGKQSVHLVASGSVLYPKSVNAP